MTKGLEIFDQPRETILSSGQRVLNFHEAGTCAGEFCPVHNPSEHDYLDLPLFFNGVHMVRQFPDGSRIPDPDDYLFNKTGTAILRNSAKCLKCEKELVSESRHDFQKCLCKNIFVDGGLDYIRHGAEDFGSYENTSQVFTKS